MKLHVGKIYFASLLTRLFVSSDYFEIIIVWRSQADISISISHGEGSSECQMLILRANDNFFLLHGMSVIKDKSNGTYI